VLSCMAESRSFSKIEVGLSESGAFTFALS
jgi:hypothetical protein